MNIISSCKNDYIITKDYSNRHNEIKYSIVKRDRINQMNFSDIHLHFIKLIIDEFICLSSSL